MNPVSNKVGMREGRSPACHWEVGVEPRHCLGAQIWPSIPACANRSLVAGSGFVSWVGRVVEPRSRSTSPLPPPCALLLVRASMKLLFLDNFLPKRRTARRHHRVPEWTEHGNPAVGDGPRSAENARLGALLWYSPVRITKYAEDVLAPPSALSFFLFFFLAVSIPNPHLLTRSGWLTR